MDIENHVTSLEQSMKLKELGLKQDSLYVWTFGKFNHIELFSRSDLDSRINGGCVCYENIENYSISCSAFLLSELVEMLHEEDSCDNYCNLINAAYHRVERLADYAGDCEWREKWMAKNENQT